MECARAILQQEIDLGRFGGAAEVFPVAPSDAEQTRFIWVQSMGIFMSRIYLGMKRGKNRKGLAKLLLNALVALNPSMINKFKFLQNENQALFCMTMTDGAGETEWTYGTPAGGERPYCSHQGGRLLDLADVNGDGKDEILAIYSPGRLGVFDLENGSLLRECKLPSDNFAFVRVGKTGPRVKDFTIMAGVSEAAYPPHEYSNPFVLIDSDLNILREYDVPGGIGHDAQVFDADGDGYDEFLAGYTLIDHNGDVLWTVKEFEEPRTRIDAGKMHADCIDIIDRDKPDAWKAAIAGSDTTYLVDHTGKTLWKQKGVHPQFIMHGRFDPKSEEERFFLFHKRLKMEMLSMDGEQIWEGLLPGNWPLGRPATVKNDYCFHFNRCASRWRNPLETGLDLIVYNEAGWPYAVDGYGRRWVEFPCPESSRQKEHRIPKHHRPDDFGYGYRVTVLDVDNDGKEEVIIRDRDYAWIYGLE